MLLEAGAVTRQPDTTAKRGRRNLYEAATPDEVDPEKLEAVLA
jgi:predicted transcriptional regulator